MEVCTRFAPSPTGYLHVGSARTALYSWLYAKQNNAKFILRIEDTDRERSTQEAVDIILDAMDWLGLSWDEGPYYQTKRYSRYEEVKDELLKKGHAYRCYCSKERLENLRQGQIEAKVKARYDGHCRTLAEQDPSQAPFVVRFKNPEEGAVEIKDLVHGHVTIKNKELDDLIIYRTDNTPTYNFTVVVDDWDMGITHVIRGDDHLTNTPRQINILHALGAKIPEYAHIPMILGPDKKRLSKRHGAVSVLQYRDEGILPHALLNYLVRLGWSHGDTEIFSMSELIKLFNVNHLNKSPAAFDHDKLLWLNHHYMKTMPIDELCPLVEWHMERLDLQISSGPKLENLIPVQLDRSKTLLELVKKSRFFYEDVVFNDKAVSLHFNANAKIYLEKFLKNLEKVELWEAPVLHDVLQQTCTELDIKLPKLAQPIRVALTGNTESPSINITLELMNRERTLKRLNAALKMM